MPRNRSSRPVAGVVALAAAAYVLVACTTQAEPKRTRPSARLSVVLGTPSTRKVPATHAPPLPGTTTPRPSRTRLAACHPPEKRVDLREPPAATTGRIVHAWRRIEHWLYEHAPRSARTLVGPASDAAVARLQTRLGRPLPPDLIASLRVHDGADDQNTATFTFPPFHVPMSAKEIAADWHTMCGVAEDTGLNGPDDWKPEFTPFAEAADGGVLYGDRNGRVGEYFAEEGTDTKGYPASYAAFLESTATLLETGRRGPSRFRAHPHDGVLDWKP